MRAQTAVVEEIDWRRDGHISRELAALSGAVGRKVTGKATRFTFLTERATNEEQLDLLDGRHFVGSGVLLTGEWRERGRRERVCYLLEGIMRRPSLWHDQRWIRMLNNYLHWGRSFSLDVAGRPYEIGGSFFCQQDGITGVCVHAALRMLLNNHPGDHAEFYTTADINDVLGISGPVTGLHREQIEAVIEATGFRTIMADFVTFPDWDYSQYLYGIVDSGCPAILSFSTKPEQHGHVVAVLGHTLNSDTWLPEARLAYDVEGPEYHSAADFVTHFLIHDNNFGPYLCMPRHAIKRFTLPSYEMRFRPRYVVGMVPRPIAVGPREAELRALRFFILAITQLASKHASARQNTWLKRLVNSSSPVLRTLCVQRDAYRQHLLSGRDFQKKPYDPAIVEELIAKLPPMMWLTEISLPDLYCVNKSKVVDVLSRCGRTIHDGAGTDLWAGLALVRLPGYCMLPSGGDLTLYRVPGPRSHFPLYRLQEDPVDEDEEVVLEW